MGQKNSKGSVSIVNADNRIRLRWRHAGKGYSLNLFQHIKANLLHAKRIAIQIEQDIILGHFDATLKKYKPSLRREEDLSGEKTLVGHFQDWVKNYRNMDCEKDVDYNSTRNMMLRWGAFDENIVVSHFNKETFGPRTYNRRLTLMKAFFTWAKKNKIVNNNPFEDVLARKVRKIEKGKRKPFSPDEIKSILTAIRDNTFCPSSSAVKHSYYYPFIYFIFKTGVRNAEAIGLRVSSVDMTSRLIYIREVLARTLKGTNAAARIRKETKNGKERSLPMSEDLESILCPLLPGKKPDDLVFTSPKGLGLDDKMFQRRVFKVVLKGLAIKDRNLYACRHTFATRCINTAITPLMTASLMGNNPETVLRNYVHITELPKDLPAIG